ncbi:MAG: hypothetical protein CMG46_02805 [Candidatus Marinimicrobia bacterium]|nr:hypothetical protein [Candidatus Neomarinimicrobiota bacterium]
MLSFSQLIIIFILLFFLMKNVEGFNVSDIYYPTTPPIGASSRYIEDIDLVKNDFIRDINRIVRGVGGRLKDEDLSEYIEYEILKAMILFEKENINDSELFNDDGSWKNEILNKLKEINTEIEQDEENALETDEERKLLKEIRGDIKRKQIERWGKPLSLMTKKEMNKIYEKELDSSTSNKICIGKKEKDDNRCKRYDNNKRGCENLINMCMYIPSLDRTSLNRKLMYFRDKIDTLEEDRNGLINENEKISSLLNGRSLRDKLDYLKELKDSDKILKGCTDQSSWNRNKKKICQELKEDIDTIIKTNEFRRKRLRRRSLSNQNNQYQYQYQYSS